MMKILKDPDSRRLLGAAVLVVLSSVMTAGCSYQGSDQDRADWAAQRDAHEQSSSPAATATPSDGGGQSTEAPSDGGGETPASDGGGEETSASEDEADTDVDNLLVKHSGDLYVSAHESAGLLGASKALGPWAYVWQVDGDAVTYQEVDCTGDVLIEETGTLKGSTLTWGGEDHTDPWAGDLDSPTTEVKVSGDTLSTDGPAGDASSHASGETKKLVGYCKDAGEDVADTLLN